MVLLLFVLVLVVLELNRFRIVLSWLNVLLFYNDFFFKYVYFVGKIIFVMLVGFNVEVNFLVKG